MNNLKENLAYLIEKHGINPSVLAKETGVNQPTIFKILAGESKEPRHSTLKPIADFFRVSVVALQEGDARGLDALNERMGEHTGNDYQYLVAQFKQVPVVGSVKGGPDGFLEELGYPPGHGDGHVEYPARDKNAYALRVRGDSMRPRIKSGEFLIVEPNHGVSPGDDVVVICKDGRKLVKELLYIKDNEVRLSSINADYEPIILFQEEVEAIHYVAAICPSGALYQP